MLQFPIHSKIILSLNSPHGFCLCQVSAFCWEISLTLTLLDHSFGSFDIAAECFSSNIFVLFGIWRSCFSVPSFLKDMRYCYILFRCLSNSVRGSVVWVHFPAAQLHPVLIGWFTLGCFFLPLNHLFYICNVCVCGFVCVFTCMNIHLESRNHLRCSLGAVHFWESPSLGAETCPLTKADQLGSLKKLPVSVSPALGSQAHNMDFMQKLWGIGYRFLCLCGKHLTDYTISLAVNMIFFCLLRS